MVEIRRKGIASFMLVLFVAIVLFAFSLEESSAQYNFDHVNVTTQVNVTNAGPEILNTTLDPVVDIVLSAGTNRIVWCNATIRDWNGYNDLNVTNATLYFSANQSDHSDDFNEHYSNASCVETGNDGQYLANYSCGFSVKYFANNGTWNCNVTVNDSLNYLDTLTNTTNISALYALNVTDVIDYGNLSVTDTSSNRTATVTNFGNMDINFSVLGYGQAEGDGWGLVCGQGSNITVGNEKFTWNSSKVYAEKRNLTITNQDFNITLLQQQDEVTPVTQDTFWQLYVPPNPFGVCTGVVRFTATTP